MTAYLAIGAVLGTAIGIVGRRRGKPIGLCLAAALLTLLLWPGVLCGAVMGMLDSLGDDDY